MNAPTLQILACSRPAVNGKELSFHANFGSSHAHLAATVSLARDLATRILAITGGSGVILAERLDGSPRHKSSSHFRRLSADRVALYEKVRELVEQQQMSWERAGRVVGVLGSSAYKHFDNAKRRGKDGAA